MKKLLGLLPLVPAILVAAAAFIGLAINQPIREEVVWPSKPDLSSYMQAEKQTEAADPADDAVSSDIVKATGSLSSNNKKKAAASSDSASAKSSKNQAKKSSSLTVTSYKTQTLKDGTYTGSAQGFGGSISVKVTVAGGKISNITVSDHSGETPSFYEKAAAIISTIIQKQTPNVDTVTGATYSSNGIREAVKVALGKAGMSSDSGQTSGKSDKKSDNTSKKDSSKKDSSKKDTKKSDSSDKKKSKDEEAEEAVPGKILKNGTYTATAQVVADEYKDFEDYTLTAEVTFEADVLVKIENPTLKPSDPTNKNYCKRALTGMADGIIGSGSPENADSIDTVTGATCSSKAVKEIYQDAWQQAKQAFEAEALSANTVSGDSVSGNAVSGDTVSGDAVSGDSMSGDTISGDVTSAEATFAGQVDVSAYQSGRSSTDAMITEPACFGEGLTRKKFLPESFSARFATECGGRS